MKYEGSDLMSCAYVSHIQRDGSNGFHIVDGEDLPFCRDGQPEDPNRNTLSSYERNEGCFIIL